MTTAESVEAEVNEQITLKGKSQMLAGVSVFSVQCTKGTIIPHLSLNKRGLIAYQNRCNTKSSDQL